MRWRQWPLGRAAAILVASAGAVSALELTGVIQWTAEAEHTVPPPTSVAAQPNDASPPEASGGIAVDVPEAGLTITMAVVGSAPELDVVWVSGNTARVVAPSGSRFAYADGRVDVSLQPGPVSVELPSSGSPLSLQVGGRVYLRRSGSQIAIEGPIVERGEDRLHFGGARE